MTQIMIRPEIRTQGGEVNDIVVRGKYAGTMSIVYRDGDVISGSVQLDKHSLQKRDRDAVVQQVQDYIQALVEAVGATECHVIVTHAAIDHVIAAESNVGVIDQWLDEEDDEQTLEFDEELEDEEEVDVIYALEEDEEDDIEYYAYDEHDADVIDHRDRLNDVDAVDSDDIEMSEFPVVFELVLVGKNYNTFEYQIYDQHEEFVADAVLTNFDREVVGEINWRYLPNEEEIEAVTDLIVSDYDERKVDRFQLEMKFDGELLEVMELDHERKHQAIESEYSEADEEFSTVLARDDGDTLTYEIYRQSHGGLPIGTATVDISRKQLTGFIDFREHSSDEDREAIANILMLELDKEKDYRQLSLTMLYKNQPIDEMLLELEQVH